MLTLQPIAQFRWRAEKGIAKRDDMFAVEVQRRAIVLPQLLVKIRKILDAPRPNGIVVDAGEDALRQIRHASRLLMPETLFGLRIGGVACFAIVGHAPQKVRAAVYRCRIGCLGHRNIFARHEQAAVRPADEFARREDRCEALPGLCQQRLCVVDTTRSRRKRLSTSST